MAERRPRIPFEMPSEPRNAGVDLQGADWSRVLLVMERLAASDDLGEVLTLIIDSMRDCLGAERASVFEYDRERHELFAHQGHGVDRSLRLSAALGLAGEAVRTGKIINVGDCYSDSRFNADVDRRTGFRTRCMLTVPLLSYGGWLEGVAQVLNKRGQAGAPAGSFDARDEMMARALASQAAVALRRAHLLSAERRKKKMEADLRVAREVQLATLPVTLPTVPGYDIAAMTRAAEETGGDTYDIAVIGGEGTQDSARSAGLTGTGVVGRPDAERRGTQERGTQRVLLLMADAAGHGVGPAMSVSRVQAMMRMALGLDVPLAVALERVNAHLHETLPVGRFVAAFAGILSPTSHTVECIAAGIAPVLVVRGDGSVEEREADTFPLGIDAGFGVAAPSNIHLGPGDSLVVLSDGFYELRREGGGYFGVERVVGAVRGARAGDRPAAAALEAVMREAAAFGGGAPLVDDQTGVILTRLR